MRKNNMVHHGKSIIKRRQYDKRDLIVENRQQNPQSEAKQSLLQISEQFQKINSKTFYYAENQQQNQNINQHSRSFSTQFFNSKNKADSSLINDRKLLNWLKSNKLSSTQSVAIKTTFSNQMRKTHSTNMNKYDVNKHEINSNNKQLLVKNEFERANNTSIGFYKTSQGFNKKIQNSEFDLKVKKIYYKPILIQQESAIQNYQDIFKSTPSKQILQILKKGKFVKSSSKSVDSSNKRQNQSELSNIKKRSIFNIRNIMFKQRIQQDLVINKQGSLNKKARNQSPQEKSQNQQFLQPKQLSTRTHRLLKIRLKNRYIKSSVPKK